MVNTETNFKFGMVVFFGRGIEEYVTMFDLNLGTMSGAKILDCPAGPASFAMQAADLGIEVVACDPLFSETPSDLRVAVDRDAQSVTEKQAHNAKLFHKELVPTSVRRKSMELFLNDYEKGKASGRYMAAALPELPFDSQSFDTVLSANLLFLYSDIPSGGMLVSSPLDYAFHKASIAEMMRVCRRELRIYPLQGPSVTEHSYLRPIMEDCVENGFRAELRPVAQRDIIGAEQMLVISRVIGSTAI